MFSLDKRRLRGDIIATFKYLEECYVEDGPRFSIVPEDTTQRNKLKLQGRFFLNVRKNS